MTSFEPTQPGPDPEPETKAHSWRHFLIPGAIALLIYVVLFRLDSRARVARGPWEVTFMQESSGIPAVAITQASLGLSNVTVRFSGETNFNPNDLPSSIRFQEPQMRVPFGVTAFDDLMYLPGTVVLHCFGHEVQMLPRTLFLNRSEIGWQSGATYTLSPKDKLPTLERPKKTSRLAKPN